MIARQVVDLHTHVATLQVQDSFFLPEQVVSVGYLKAFQPLWLAMLSLMNGPPLSV